MLLESKNVEFTAVEEAAEVRFDARRRVKEFEFINLVSLKNKEFNLLYFEVNSVGIWVKLLV
jgi:hypothetical protein